MKSEPQYKCAAPALCVKAPRAVCRNCIRILTDADFAPLRSVQREMQRAKSDCGKIILTRA